jgi:hypothetical protein
MNLKDSARNWLRTVAPAHVGTNVRSYNFATYVGDVGTNMLGGISYLSPQEGKVVEICDRFTLIKTSANRFCVVLNSLLNQPVGVGDKIRAAFYELRRFDGSLADGSDDGGGSVALTGAQTRFPVKWAGRYLGIDEKFEASYRTIQNPYLQDLITQMESMKVNDGYRRVVNVLVDANAKNLDFVDPPEDESCAKPPAIKASVATTQFVGEVEIFYDRADDTYGINLHPTPEDQLAAPLVPGSQAERHMRHGPFSMVNIGFEELGDALQVAIDDQEWLKAKVTNLKRAPTKRLKEQVSA